MSNGQVEWIWMNGKSVPWGEANVHVTTHTLHLGSGVFEAMRCYETAEGPAVFRLDEHLERLFFSASVYQIELPYTREELAEAVCELIRLNSLSACYVRLLAYFGSGSLGVLPRNCPVGVIILAYPFGAYLGDDVLENGVRATVSTWTKFHSRMMPTTAKACGNYLNSILAVREAVGQGFHEAILLDIDGNVAEGSGENIFVVKDGRLLTNDADSSILLGITREAVLEIAGDFGLEVVVRKLSLDDLLSADEAFFTGTAAEVTPIREIDGRLIGSEPRGPITRRIQQTFFDATSGREARYSKWLHFVNLVRV
ncbi:MAG: branched-chain amino acid aminotransferase [Acidobacteriota bacterium]|nr:branched-chain amino acid aminotransferase [Acidobacteriota bacterium]